MLLRLLLLDLFLLLDLRQAEIQLPADQDERGKDDGENACSFDQSFATRSRPNARVKSLMICSNGSDSAARRPTST